MRITEESQLNDTADNLIKLHLTPKFITNQKIKKKIKTN